MGFSAFTDCPGRWDASLTHLEGSQVQWEVTLTTYPPTFSGTTQTTIRAGMSASLIEAFQQAQGAAQAIYRLALHQQANP